MATAQHSISGISSRRSACDRCRFLKTRCLRQHADQARCDRCSRSGADTECITSPIFRVRSWQPPAAKTAASEQVIADTPGRSISRANKRQKRYSSQERPNQLPTPDGSSLPLDLSLASPGSRGGQSSTNATASCEDFDWSRHSSVPSLHNVLNEEVLGGQMDIPFCPVDETFEINFPDDFMAIMSPSTSGADSTATLPSIYVPRNEVGSGYAVQPSPEFPPQTSDDNGSLGNTGHVTDAESTPIQHMSKLDYELITILARLDREPPSAIVKSLVETKRPSSSPSVVDNIISKTSEFIDILKLLTEPCLSPIQNLPSTVSRPSIQHFSRATRRSSFSSSCSGYDSDADSSAHDDTESPDQPCPPSLPTHQELDKPSLLLVVAVYIRLLKLHLILVANLYEYLKELSESENPHLHPILVLGISGLPIRKVTPSCCQFSKVRTANADQVSTTELGNMQLLVFLQIITSMFERIDALLGLPKEFQISRGREEQSGLLGTSFLGPIRCILREEDSGDPKNGKGGIEALRRHIAKAKKLLRRRIAP